MKKRIVICEYVSTGLNLIDDVLARGYEPVLLEGSYDALNEDAEMFRQNRAKVNASFHGRYTIIPENPDYDAVLSQVRALDPALVIAGSEFGVPIACRLAEDLGLPGNPADRIRAMTEKDAMHEALRNHGLRYIRGRVVCSEQEAEAYYDELRTEEVVVKPPRGAATLGVYICRNREEMLNAVRIGLEASRKEGWETPGILIQERIRGTEYIVNTVSCNGRHRVVSVWIYDKVKMPNGGNVYNTAMCVPRLEVGHSRLLRYACQVADAIGIKYGPVHGEYMVDEQGPVLIEVNCRPMGAGMHRKFVERIFGQHETDSALDSYLNPEKFERAALQNYRIKEFGAIKLFIQQKETEVLSAPILQIAMHLKSFYSASLGQIGQHDRMPETQDLETAGGTVFLIHEDEQQVRADCELLHLLEMKYPRILFQDSLEEKKAGTAKRDMDTLVKTAMSRGTTLIFSDSGDCPEGPVTVNAGNLKDAYDSFEVGILDLSAPESFRDLESIVQLTFTFAGKIRKGGIILIPESTYCNLPYGMEGMEILLKVAGLSMELPVAGKPELLVASVQ